MNMFMFLKDCTSSNAPINVFAAPGEGSRNNNNNNNNFI